MRPLPLFSLVAMGLLAAASTAVSPVPLAAHPVARVTAHAVWRNTARGQTPDGKALFETHCRKCHGPAGTPIAAMKKLLPELPTWDAAFFAKRTDADIVAVLTNGKGKNMKSFSDRLKPDEMLAVAKYIRTLTP